MRIFTIQTYDAWQSLQARGVLRASVWHQSDLAPLAYQWMRQQMCARIGHPPHSFQVPLWGWAHEDAQSMIDIRRHWMPVSRYCQIEIELKETAVLVSDFDLWHIVLMDDYVALDDQDRARFDREVARQAEAPAGLSGQRPSRGLRYSASLRDQVVESWQRIFHHDNDQGGEGGQTQGSSYQACFWEIQPSDIVDVIEFRSIVEPDYDDD